ncbi:NADP-binding protein [Dacryopinax primogenitus]|uniref:NADP-binding protein n=1 Tax=Dacryopinax primogenitus (strain DJM 731) TaxID=1858805 RepID=M5G766_DACPD|nr:NADP-binding protein [Dacryopinax primogenitus]EJU01657.1 NADP-binding protein [Dacryopinax primogenitus]
MSLPNPTLIFLSRPLTFPTSTNISLLTPSINLSLPLEGGFLTRTLWVSLDPYMRGRMTSGWEEGSVWSGFGVSEVLRSEVEGLKVGDKLYGHQPYQAYILHPPSERAAYRLLPSPSPIPLSAYLGPAGMPGKTAFYGLKALAHPQAGEKIFVSAAAGAVGQLVCQLCKAWGVRVLGSAGSEDKVRFLIDQLGVEAFNYKEVDTALQLKRFGPVDVYWDNVGGETLDCALEAMNRRGRIVVCGHISMYNVPKEQRYGLKNTHEMIYKELSMQGLSVTPYEQEYADEFYATVPPLIAHGEIKYMEEVTEGLENAAEAFVGLLKGENRGKVVVKVT